MADKEKSAKSDAGRAQVQSEMDKVQEKGHFGDAVDPTPNEAYTVAGVTAGDPTPETDVEAEKAASGPGPLESEAILNEAREKNADKG